MANLGMTFDPAQVPQDEFENPPDGRYLSQIIESDVMDKDNGVKTAWYQFEIMEGPLERRQFRIWADLVNPGNEIAEKIGNQTQGKLCDAARTGPVDDTEALHFIPMFTTLKTNKGGFQNMAKAEPYSAAPQGHQPQQQPAQRQQYQQPANNGGAAMPNNGGQRRWGNRQANA